MKKTARLIITFNCERSCSYCCNKYKSIINKGIKIDNLSLLKYYEEICITGGEPTLNPTRTLNIIKQIRKLNKKVKIYLYTAKYIRHSDFNNILKLVDGVHFTLHKNSSEEDIKDFHVFQNLLKINNCKGLLGDKSYRLFIHPDIRFELSIHPSLWKRVEMKPWLEEGNCPLPENEILYVLNEKFGEIK